MTPFLFALFILLPSAIIVLIVAYILIESAGSVKENNRSVDQRMEDQLAEIEKLFGENLDQIKKQAPNGVLLGENLGSYRSSDSFKLSNQQLSEIKAEVSRDNSAYKNL